MDVTQIIINNILLVLGGAGALVTGLSTWLGKIISDRIIQREKAFFDKELKLVESKIQIELKSKELANQISSETYRKIFDKRIEIYTNLLEIKNIYVRFVRESHIPEVDDPTDDYHNIYTAIRDVIEKNPLYISSDLANAYSLWYDKAIPFIKAAKMAGYHAYENSSSNNEIDRNVEVEFAENIKLSQMIIATQDEMEAILLQIDRDISDIRMKIETLIKT